MVTKLHVKSSQGLAHVSGKSSPRELIEDANLHPRDVPPQEFSPHATGAVPPRPAACIDQLEYMADMIDELYQIANRAGYSGLDVLLRLARDEARRHRTVQSRLGK